MATQQATETSWIRKRPDVQGGDPCVRDTRITVHGLVEWRNLGQSDQQIVDSILGLTQADLDEAWRYYDEHRDEIDGIIRLESAE